MHVLSMTSFDIGTATVKSIPCVPPLQSHFFEGTDDLDQEKVPAWPDLLDTFL